MSASVRSLSSGASDSEGGRSPSPPAGSPLSDTKRARAAEKARHKEEIKRVKAAQRKERTALIFRRDTLSYFDAARVVGPLVFVDTVPLVFNAVLVASLGNVVTFKDGGLRCVFPVLAAGSSPSIKFPCDCGVGFHMYLQGLVGISYVLLMYMTSVALGGHVTAHVNAPFIFVSLTLAGLLAWGFFFGLPVTLVLLSEIVAGSIRESKCFKEHPWLYAFFLLEFFFYNYVAAKVLLKWAASSAFETVKIVVRAFIQRCCRRIKKAQDLASEKLADAKVLAEIKAADLRHKAGQAAEELKQRTAAVAEGAAAAAARAGAAGDSAAVGAERLGATAGAATSAAAEGGAAGAAAEGGAGGAAGGTGGALAPLPIRFEPLLSPPVAQPLTPGLAAEAPTGAGGLGVVRAELSLMKSPASPP